MKRRLVAGTVAVAAAAVVAVAASAEAPPGDAVPPIWPLPATTIGAVAFALSAHTVVTDRLRPASVAATTATVLLATLATAPTFNYTWHSLSAPYLLVGVTALPAALGAAARRRSRRLTAVLAVVVLALGVAASLRDVHWSLLHRMAAHLATSTPGAVVGYLLTHPARTDTPQ